MIELITIEPTSLFQYVSTAYWDDYELFKLYHIKEFDTCMEACEATIYMIAEMHAIKPLTYYKVQYDGIDIGYMVTYENCLYSFGIAIRFRNASILKEWMQAVRDLFKSDFNCLLYNRNKRAIEFLVKNGMKISGVNQEYDFVKLVNEYSCQN